MTTITLFSTQLVEDRRAELPVALLNHRDDLGEIAGFLIGRKDREHMLALYLNTNGYVVGVSVVAIGHVSGVSSTPKDILRAGILLGAPACALAHNHPSGNLYPSPEDIDFAKRLSAAAKIIGMVMVDSIIVHFDRYRSMYAEVPECCIETDNGSERLLP